MRGATAKAIRRAAEAQAAHLPVTKYYNTEERVKVHTDPFSQKTTVVNTVTTRLEPECQRAVYKLLKSLFKDANSNS